MSMFDLLAVIGRLVRSLLDRREPAQPPIESSPSGPHVRSQTFHGDFHQTGNGNTAGDQVVHMWGPAVTRRRGSRT